MLPPKHRLGSYILSAKLYGLYQAAQNRQAAIFVNTASVPPEARAELLKLRDRKSSAGGGKKYWADGVRILEFLKMDGLRYEKPSTNSTPPSFSYKSGVCVYVV
jgi:hypothetical protein